MSRIVSQRESLNQSYSQIQGQKQINSGKINTKDIFIYVLRKWYYLFSVKNIDKCTATVEEKETMVTNGHVPPDSTENKLQEGSTNHLQSNNSDNKIVTSESGAKGSLLRQKSEDKRKKTCTELMFQPFMTLYRGWSTYTRQKVFFAGLSLALLYMTVLGFDSVTVGM